MAPKKKGGKRQEEDWEADLGESAPAVDAPTGEPANGDENEEAPVGGLMAALRKNKAKKAKKGKQTNDFVEGEDAEAAPAASKEPEEGTFDEDDVFAGKPKKQIKEVAPTPATDEPEEGEFRVKSKKEKEREKKEREKARKKEQVWLPNEYYTYDFTNLISTIIRPPQRRRQLLPNRRPMR
jgi:translation initiation factor 5B